MELSRELITEQQYEKWDCPIAHRIVRLSARQLVGTNARQLVQTPRLSQLPKQSGTGPRTKRCLPLMVWFYPPVIIRWSIRLIMKSRWRPNTYHYVKSLPIDFANRTSDEWLTQWLEFNHSAL